MQRVRRYAIIGVLSITASLTPFAYADIGSLPAATANKQVQRGELVLIDVRSPTEWAMTGMPRDSIGAPMQAADFIAQARGAVLGDLDQPIAVLGRGDEDAREAAEKLEAEGFREIYIIAGGMGSAATNTQGWLSSSLPTDGFIVRD